MPRPPDLSSRPAPPPRGLALVPLLLFAVIVIAPITTESSTAAAIATQMPHHGATWFSSRSITVTYAPTPK